ncbi:hypothetical protein HZC31_07305 [Candidatus Woesearchaeota archaeon]|nr:hypothetical protein [Candidatus Woesearchaeota archaeon]
MVTRKAIVDFMIVFLSLIGFGLVIYGSKQIVIYSGFFLVIVSVVFIFWKELAYAMVKKIQGS